MGPWILQLKFLRKKDIKAFLKVYGPILLEVCLTGEFIFIFMKFSRVGLLIISRIALIYDEYKFLNYNFYGSKENYKFSPPKFINY